MQVRSMGREDPQEEEMGTHSSILAWEISWTEEPGGIYSKGSQRVTTEHAHVCMCVELLLYTMHTIKYFEVFIHKSIYVLWK